MAGSAYGTSDNFVCSHEINESIAINKYYKSGNKEYVQIWDKNEAIHTVIFEDDNELHMSRIAKKDKQCTTNYQITTIINKNSLESVVTGICVSSTTATIFPKCAIF